MPYPTLAPTLSALNSVLSAPADNEVASAWPAVDRQTRNWLYSFLTQYFDPSTNQLKPAAIGGGTVPTGSVLGTNPADSSQRQIVQGSVQALDLADNAVTANKVIANAITNTKIADNAVTSTKIADGSVTASKLAAAAINGSAITPASVTATALATGSVGPSALQDNAVQSQHVTNRSIDGAKLPVCATGQIFVGGNTVDGQPNCAVPLTLSGAIAIDATGNVTISGLAGSGTTAAYARLVEVALPGVNCGPSNSPPVGTALTGPQGWSAQTQWQGRGLGVGSAPPTASAGWVKLTDVQNILTLSDTIITVNLPIAITTTDNKNYPTYRRPIYVNQECTLLIQLSIPGFSCQTHRCRLTAFPDASAPTVYTDYLGTSEYAAPGGFVQNRSTLTAVIAFKAPVGLTLPYFYVDWFAQLARPTNGMGIATGLGGNEYYGDLSIIRVV